MRYRIVPDTEVQSADAIRAADLARELKSLMGPAVSLMYLQEFALACVVTRRTGRAGFEELLGEPVPDGLWQALEELAKSKNRFSLSDAGELNTALAIAALGCVSTPGGGRPQLEERLDRAITDEEWLKVEEEVVGRLPRRKRKWRQMRDGGMMEFPESLLGGALADDHKDFGPEGTSV